MASKRQTFRQDYPMPQVSIITVVKNNADGLRLTLESAQTQDFLDWELVIVYGKSEDSTISVAKNYVDKDSRIKLVEQDGSGIYQAMNLGIENSSSEFLWFMNSGDCFIHFNSLRQGVEELAKTNHGFVVGSYKIRFDSRTFKLKERELTQLRLAISRRGGCHQAMIFRKSAVDLHFGFNTSYALASDYDLCLKLIKSHGAKCIPTTLALVEPDGISDKNLEVMHLEKAAIRRKTFQGKPVHILIGWLWRKAASMKLGLRTFLHGKKHPLG